MKQYFHAYSLIMVVVLSSCVPAPAPVATNPPLPSETVTPTYDLISTLTPTPTSLTAAPLAFTNTPTPAGAAWEDLSRVDRYLRIYYEDLPVILGDMINRRYLEAIIAWDAVIEALPDYGYAYYQRAESYQQLGRRALDLEEAQSAFKAALDDNQKALALAALSGDLYLQRYQISWRRAWFEPLREARTAMFVKAAKDLSEALRLGTSDPGAARREAFLSLDLGHCQEALDRFSALVEAPANYRRAEIHEGLARAYLCFGWLDAARSHIDLALAIQNSAQAQLAKVVILINQGELDTALAMLDAWIAVDPYFYGERYFLRALIYHDQGRYAEASEDINTGRTQMWGQGGLGAYVEGLLAIQEGDSDRGRELIKYAEATLPYDYGPLLGRIRADLELPLTVSAAPIIPPPAAALLTATPALPGKVTPAAPTDETTTTPALDSSATLTDTNGGAAAAIVTPTSTPWLPDMLSATAVLTATQVVSLTEAPVIPSYFGSPLSFPVRDLPVSYNGSGPFSLGTQHGGLTLFFRPPERFMGEFVNIRSLSFILSPAGEMLSLNLYLLFFRYERPDVVHSSPGFPLDWGENAITPPPGYIDRSGGFFVRLVNQGWQALEVGDIAVRIVVKLEDGRVVPVGGG